MTNTASNVDPQANPVKRCKYECGTLIFWDYSVDAPYHSKWREKDTGIIHDLNRCCHVIGEREKGKNRK